MCSSRAANTETNDEAGHAFLAKYDSDGAEQWQDVWSGTRSAFATDAATDAEGNVYVTGSAMGEWNAQAERSPMSLFLRKYTSNLELLWEATEFGRAAEGSYTATDVTVSSNGFVFVTGGFQYQAGVTFIYGPYLKRFH